MRNILAFLPRLWANWVTLLGALVASMAGMALLITAIVELMSSRNNSYRSGLLIISLPLLLLLGLGIIPIGFAIQRRRSRRLAAQGRPATPDPIAAAFRLAVQDSRSRGLIVFVGLFTVINVALIAVGGHSAATFMDSPRFCGTTCHTPMEPEWTAYQRSAHNQVACVECHVGPGAGSLIQAKLNGLGQLFGLVTSSYHRPVPVPVEHLRGAAATCERCHARSQFIGERVRMYPHYKTDEENTPVFNVMLNHVGGRDSRTGKYSGIHAHVAPGRAVAYEYLDAQRTRIGKITVLQDGKVTAIYQRPDAERKEKPLGERVMDCIDCHNRPSHRFDGTARQAVERAMFEGKLDAKQPYLAKVAAELLNQAEVPREGAAAHFKTALRAAYASLPVPLTAAALDQAAQSLTALYLRNIFPAMRVRWNTYPSLAGHYSEAADETVGCLRCHDGKHETRLPDGKLKTIDKSCELCHDTMATAKAPEKFEDALKQVLGLPLD